jgi:hypothetical protein
MNLVKNIFAGALACAIITLSPSLLMAQAGKAKVATTDALLNIIQDDLLFALRVNNLTGTTDNVDTYITGVSPVPMSVTMLIKMQLGHLFGDPSLSGFNLAGDFMVVGLQPKGSVKQPEIVVFAAVDNYDDFVKNHPNCTIDNNVYAVINTAATNKTPLFLAKSPSEKFMIVAKDSEILLPYLDKLKNKATKKLATSLNKYQGNEAVNAPIWLYANINALCTHFKNEIQQSIEMASDANRVAMVNMPKESTNMLAFFMKLYSGVIKTLSTESDSITVAITPTANLFSTNVVYQARVNTKMARMLIPNTNKTTFAFSQCFDNNKAINGFIKINDVGWQKFYQRFFDFINQSATSEKDKEVIKNVRHITSNGLAALGESVAYSFNYASKPPYIDMTKIVAINDQAAFRRLITEVTTVTSDLYKVLGFQGDLQYKPAIEKYKGVEIDQIITNVKMSDFGNTPLKYSGEGTYTMALINDKLFITTGERATEDLKNMIDAKESNTPTGDIKLALDMLGADATKDMVQSINVIKMAKGYVKMTSAIAGEMPQGENMFAPMLEIINAVDIPTQSCIGIGTTIDHGQVRFKIAIPKRHLSEIATAVIQIQQKIMMQQMDAPQ